MIIQNLMINIFNWDENRKLNSLDLLNAKLHIYRILAVLSNHESERLIVTNYPDQYFTEIYLDTSNTSNTSNLYDQAIINIINGFMDEFHNFEFNAYRVEDYLQYLMQDPSYSHEPDEDSDLFGLDTVVTVSFKD